VLSEANLLRTKPRRLPGFLCSPAGTPYPTVHEDGPSRELQGLTTDFGASPTVQQLAEADVTQCFKFKQLPKTAAVQQALELAAQRAV
jgi:hypothetical protein